MNSIIEFSLKQRFFIMIVSLIILFFGVKAYKQIPIDAFPDIAPVQVKIILKADGMTPAQMEAQVTTPLEINLLGIPHQTIIRSISKYGLSDITIDFEDGTDIYWARQQINERLNSIKDDLPKGLEGGLAPISSPLSDILMFTIESKNLSLTQKRTLLDWVIAPKLRAISGVAEVNSIGGKVKTYQVVPDLQKMRTFGITLDMIVNKLEQNNKNYGAGRITQGVESILVRSVGKLQNINDIASTPIKKINNQVILLSDVASVEIGHLTRAGFVTKDGIDEAVQGLVIGLRGIDTSKVLKSVKKELQELQKHLPSGTKIDIFYDRGDLVTHATDTVKKALIEAIILIIVILLLMLGNLASAFSVMLILPFALLMSFICMKFFGLSANLMSLGGLAIAIGILVDSAVVVVEHITTKLGEKSQQKNTTIQTISQATKQMAPSIITGVLIIIIVFMPLFTLEGLEGKLFAPVALSIVFALFSSLILSLTLIPVLSSFILKNKEDKQPPIMKWFLKLYKPILQYSLNNSKKVLTLVILLFFISIGFAYKTGKTFMPTMDEGSIIIGIEFSPSISLNESKKLNLKIQKSLLKEVKEIKNIIARTGSDELGLDPMGLNDTDTFLVLEPKESWSVKTKEQLQQKIRKVLDRFVGIEYSFTQPIQMRVSEMLTGTRGDLAIDIFGEDSKTLEKIANQIKSILENIKGSTDVYKKANEGIEYLELKFNKKALGYYEITQDEVAEFLKAMITGYQVGIIQEKLRMIPLVIKGKNSLQNSLKNIENLYIVLEDGSNIPLKNLVYINSSDGAVQIEHENGYRKTVVQTNVKDRDLVGFVEEAKKIIEKDVKLPVGYYITYGGEFKNQQRAMQKLSIIIPLALILIFIQLFISFKSIKQATIIMINVPLALIGGFIGLYFSGEYLSVPASVGFIALLGIAVLNGVVLVNYFNTLKNSGYNLIDTVTLGATKRLRPVLMTAMIAAFGLLPLLFATGPGSQIQKPLAIVVINGLISSTFLTLVVLPILYVWIYNKQRR